MPKLARRAVLIASLTIACLAMTPASALIVMNYDPSNNYVAPTQATNPGAWGTNADPGWANSTTNGVYLGSGWVLTAGHTGVGNGSTEVLNGDSYSVVKNSGVSLRNPTSLTNLGYSQLSDVKLVRLNSNQQFSGTPEANAVARGLQIKPITLSAATPPANRSLVIIANGLGRATGDNLLYTSKANQNDPWPTPSACVNCLPLSSSGLQAIGYQRSGPERLAWGTNKIESSSQVANRLQDFKSAGGTGYYVLDNTNSTTDFNTAVLAFDFDEYSGFTFGANGRVNGGGGNEVQAASNDSGSGVYSWNSVSSTWELSGVLHTIACYVPGAQGCGAYGMALRQSGSPLGDMSVFTDISAYRTQIEAYMAPPVGYEWNGQGADTRFFSMVGRNVAYDAAGSLVVTEGMWGDINLDGVVSGDGSGAWATDDVTAFVQGWGYQQGSGDILSWKRGDMNQDGRVDLDDFLLLRQGVQQASGASLSLSALFGGSSQVVPEPATAGILAAAGLGLLAWRRLRRSR
jgi:hypothetical protein